MKKTPLLFCALLVAAISLVSMPRLDAEAADSGANTKCRMNFDLAGWSIFYKTAKGTGVIRCTNGQRANVKLKATGGGISFGKSELKNGKGSFSKVNDISQLFGGYAESDAHAGASKSADAYAMTKGNISLAISGTGEGWSLGFAFGKFSIKPVQ